jgi:predicted aspartyl protease
MGLVATTGALASDTPEPQSPPLMTGRAATVPFDLYQGYFMVVHESVGRLKSLNFFVDTGTSSPVLDSRLAKKLKLHGEEPASITILGGIVSGAWANLPTLKLGPIEQSNLQVVTADLSFFERSIPVRIDGIVGLEVFGQSPFVIDYSARVIRFGAEPGLPFSVPLRRDAGLAVFDAVIDLKPVHLLFDTGASSLVLFTGATPQSSNVKIAVNLQAEAIGNFESKEIRLRLFQLGAEEFRKKSALVTRNPEPARIDFDGVISPVTLGITRISVNLQKGVLAFSR